MKLVIISLYILLMILGVLMFVYAEYDDSPGGQLIGLTVAIFGLVGLIKKIRKHLKKPSWPDPGRHLHPGHP